MIEYIVSMGTVKKMKIKPQDLMSKSVGDIISEKYVNGTLISFDGVTASIMDGEDQKVLVDPEELILNSAEKVIKKKLKTQKKLNIRVGKQ